MSTYIDVAIKIKIPQALYWLNIFIDSIYAQGQIYVHPLDKPYREDEEVELLDEDAYTYFERYIYSEQNRTTILPLAPHISWAVDKILYSVIISANFQYLEWSISLPANKICKDSENEYPDYKYYIELL